MDCSNNSLIVALNDGTKTEQKMGALHLMLEFGSASQKAKAMKEIKKVAFGDTEAEEAGEEEGESSESQSIDSNEEESGSESA